MRFGSGTYNVRETEVSKDVVRMAQRSLLCTVHFLDGSQEDFELDKHSRGQELLERVYEHLELIEKDYFGLQYADLVPEPDNMRWLEPSKSIRRQMQCPPYVLYFRVKFYVSDPSKLQEEYTRYHFYLQIRQDVHSGRLVCPESSAALLGSYAVQSEFGDYCEEEHGDNYLDAFQFLRNQTTSLIKKVMELHKLHRGQTPADAEFNFLDHAKRLDMYGVDLYHARDANLAEIQLGVTSYGVVIFQQSSKINTFSWPKVLKISFKRKQFFIQLKAEEEEEAETLVGFNMTSTQASKMLWKSCIEHHTFFRLISPPQVQPKGLFSLGSRYRYNGRTEYQTLEDMKRKARIERTFHRTGSRYSYARSTIGPSFMSPGARRFVPSIAAGSLADETGSGVTMMTTTFGPDGPITSAMGGGSNGGVGGTHFVRYYNPPPACQSSSALTLRKSVSASNAACSSVCSLSASNAAQQPPDQPTCICDPDSSLYSSIRRSYQWPARSVVDTTPPPQGSIKEGLNRRNMLISALTNVGLNRKRMSMAEGAPHAGGTMSTIGNSNAACLVHSNSAFADVLLTNRASLASSAPAYPSENNSNNCVVFNGIRNGSANGQSSSSVSPQTHHHQQQQPPPPQYQQSQRVYPQHHQPNGVPNENGGGGSSSNSSSSYRLLSSPNSARSIKQQQQQQQQQTQQAPSASSSRASSVGQSNNAANGRETTFGPTVISSNNILDVVDDVLIGEQSFEFPRDQQQQPIGGSESQQNMPYTSVQAQPATFQISRLANGRATINHGSNHNGAMVKNALGTPPPPAYPSQQRGSPSIVDPHHNHRALIHGNGSNGGSNGYHHVTNPTTSNGQQRTSTASRNSLTNTASPQHHRASPSTGQQRSSPLVGNGHHPGGEQTDNNSPSNNILVTIRMKPDPQGRFGFNVKGGADQNYPIIVSRVIPGSPADACMPRLNEGDQVLMINGRDVGTYTHDQVVRFIRSCREAHTGELQLIVRPNAYEGEDVDEPEFQYVPQTPHVSDCVPRSDKLQQSVLLLADNLASGSAIIQFEQLYRKKPGLTLDMARTSENMNKNRYRDISPYDSTRVIIKSSIGGGDYINASFVNMEIPTSGVVNRYIAAQGPLPHTAGDFWQVVWEQLCPTVVMLTATVERGRVKCHQYWPRLYESQEYGRLQISCLREKETPVGFTREFSIVNQETKEERLVTQMQYVVWPDHGVPEDPKQFIDFVAQVRQFRAGMVEPMVVHCSAGIGRTGVLILMETAMCLVEANEPVYPLDLVRTMRDQRAMLIQTASQYKFVCEAIVKAFNEGMIKPLAEYQQSTR